MSTAVLVPQGNNITLQPNASDRRMIRQFGSPGQDSSPTNQRECMLTMIECGAVKQGVYPTNQTAIPRISISWTAAGRGPLDVEFDAERGGSFALTGTGLTISAFFDDFNPAFACPPYQFFYSSSHALSVGRNCSTHSRALVIPPESGIRLAVPRWAYNVWAVGSITGGILELHPDDAGVIVVGAYTIPITNPALAGTPAWLHRPIPLSSHERFYTVRNPSAVNTLRTHLRFKIAV